MERTWTRVSLGLGCESLILPVSRENAARCDVRELMIRSLGIVVDSIMGVLQAQEVRRREIVEYVHIRSYVRRHMYILVLYP